MWVLSSYDIQLTKPGIPVATARSHLQPSETMGVLSETEFQPTRPLARGRKNSAAGLLLGKERGDAADCLLSVKDVARALAVSTATVYGLCDSGKLPHVRVLNVIRVRPPDLRGFIAAGIRTGR